MINHHSWQLINDYIISKKADASLLKTGVSTLPIQYRGFFEFTDNDVKARDIEVEYQNQKYNCRLSLIEVTNCTKIDLHFLLRNKIRLLVPNFLNCKSFPFLVFYKRDSNHYNLTIEKSLDNLVIKEQEGVTNSNELNENIENNSDADPIQSEIMSLSYEDLRKEIEEHIIKKPGTEKQFLMSKYNVTSRKINKVLNDSGIIEIKGKLYKTRHIPCIESLYQHIDDLVYSQIRQNEGFTHIKHVLSGYLSIEPDFFFYTPDFKDPIFFFRLVNAIFKECDKGDVQFVQDSLTIWNNICSVPHNIMGILMITARHNNNIITKQLIIETLQHFGSSEQPYSAFCMSLGRSGVDPRPFFYQLDEESFILVESLKISNDFMEKLCEIISQLIGEDDYVPYRDINDDVWEDYFKRISNIQWGPLLLRDILNNNLSPYLSITSGNNMYSVPDAAIVKKESGIENFADLVMAALLLKKREFPIEMSYQELRQMLVDELLLGPNEKRDNLFKSLDDIRFHWTQNNKYVTINKG